MQRVREQKEIALKKRTLKIEAEDRARKLKQELKRTIEARQLQQQLEEEIALKKRTLKIEAEDRVRKLK